MNTAVKGSFFWKKNNTLHLDYYVSVKGKKVRKRPKFRSAKTSTKRERLQLEAEAKDELCVIADRQQQNEQIFDNFGTVQYPTYSQIAHFFWEKKWCHKPYFAEKEYHATPDYGKLLKSIDYFGDTPANEVQRIHIKEYRKSLGKKKKSNGDPLSNAYINRLVAMIGQVYHFCIGQEEFDYEDLDRFEQEKYGNINMLANLDNPIKGLPKKTETPKKFYVPTLEEFCRFVSELKPSLQYLALTGIHTALRRRNVVRLKWEHVDLFNGYINVPDYKGCKYGIPLRLKMSEELHEMMKFLFKHKNESEYVHLKEDGKPYIDFHRAWDAALLRAKVPHFPFRALRNIYVTWAVERNVALGLLQKSLGHKTVQTVSKHYNQSQHATDLIVKEQPTIMPTGTFG